MHDDTFWFRFNMRALNNVCETLVAQESFQL